MNWRQQFKQRVEQERQPKKMPQAKEVSKPEPIEKVEAEPAQVNPAERFKPSEGLNLSAEIPVAVPAIQRKPIDDNRGDLFLPDLPKASAKTPAPETPSIPATSTDRREVSEQKREKQRIYCFRCRQPTPHAEMPCDLEQYAASWFVYACGVCGLKAYATGEGDYRQIRTSVDDSREATQHANLAMT